MINFYLKKIFLFSNLIGILFYFITEVQLLTQEILKAQMHVVSFFKK